MFHHIGRRTPEWAPPIIHDVKDAVRYFGCIFTSWTPIWASNRSQRCQGQSWASDPVCPGEKAATGSEESAISGQKNGKTEQKISLENFNRDFVYSAHQTWFCARIVFARFCASDCLRAPFCSQQSPRAFRYESNDYYQPGRCCKIIKEADIYLLMVRLRIIRRWLLPKPFFYFSEHQIKSAYIIKFSSQCHCFYSYTQLEKTGDCPCFVFYFVCVRC